MLCRHAEALGRYEPGRVTAPPVWIEAAEEFETVRLSRLRPTPGKVDGTLTQFLFRFATKTLSRFIASMMPCD